MSEVYRTLPEFPKYEITSDGDVRNRWTKKKLKEVENKKTGAFSYSLRRNDGSSTCRNFWGLIYSAFPELKPEEKPVEKTVKLVRPYKVWTVIPGFPKYLLHPDGRVKYKASKRIRKLMHDPTGTPYYVLFNEYGDSNRVKVRRLLCETFPETREAV
jgi:hypothetical protein